MPSWLMISGLPAIDEKSAQAARHRYASSQFHV
jgi:hypothetical protein